MRVRRILLTAISSLGVAALLSACSSSTMSPQNPTTAAPVGGGSFDAQRYLAPFASRSDFLEFSNSVLSNNLPIPSTNCPGTPVTINGNPASVKWNYATAGVPPANLDITGCDVGIYVGPSVKGVATIWNTRIFGDSNVMTGIWVDHSNAYITGVQVQGITVHSSVKCTASTCVVTQLHALLTNSAVPLRAEAGTNIFVDQLMTDGYTDRGFLCIASACGITHSHTGGPGFESPNPQMISPIGFHFFDAVITNVLDDRSDGDGSPAKGFGFASICSVDSNGIPVTESFFAADVQTNSPPDPVFVFNSFTNGQPNFPACSAQNPTY
jgi:hypothetical protein